MTTDDLNGMTRRDFIKLTSPSLGKPVLEPMPVQEWSLPGLNVGYS